MDFLPQAITQYAETYTEAPSDLLKEVEAYTLAEVPDAQMLSGHLQGRCLAMIARILRPRLVVEIGTYTGYSALCLCEGLPPDGRLITFDINDMHVAQVQHFFDISPWSEQISYQIGDARTLLPKVNDPIDLLFIDADKVSYPLYYGLSIDMITKGGLIVADNVLWSGKVTSSEANHDDETRALHRFNKITKQDARVAQLLLPIRDGLMVLQKQ